MSAMGVLPKGDESGIHLGGLEVAGDEAGAGLFSQELLGALAPLREALRTLLGEWGSPQTPKELQKVSGMGWTISWRVFRIVHSEEVTDVRHAPTPAALKGFLAAALREGLSPATIERVRVAAEAFQKFIKMHAKDRAAFESMLGGAGDGDEGSKIVMTQRRAAYRAMSHVLGAQMDLRYGAFAVRRSASGKGTDALHFYSMAGMRRLRPEVKLKVFATRRNASGVGGSAAMMDRREWPMDEKAMEVYGMPVLPRFSKEPFPEVERIELPEGITKFQTVGRAVGVRGSLELTFGQIYRESALQQDVDGREVYHFTSQFVLTPVGTAVLELLVHRPSFPKARPEMVVYDPSDGDHSPAGVRRAQKYPVDERIVRVGRADQVGLAELPQYGEMMKYGAETVGWDLSEFDVWRVKMPFPILHSVVRLWFYAE